MSKSSRLFLQIRESEFEQIPPKIRERFSINKVEPDDEDLFAGDEVYGTLISRYRKAAKELRDYKYNKRHSK